MFDGRVLKYGFIALMLASAAALFINRPSTDLRLESIPVEPGFEPPPPEPVPERIESRLLFGGDVYWGRLVDRDHPGDYAFPFSGLDTLNRSEYDAWIANFECPITDEVVSFEDQWNAIQFNCKPEYLPEAAKWFDVVSLANNHTANVRNQEGLDETRANLEAHNIQHFGHYEPGVLEDTCEIVTVGASMILDDDSVEAVELPIAMCGYHSVFRQLSDVEISQITEYAENFITISMPHAGAEYVPSSDSIRETQFRAMVDAGADAVLAGHPHWVQNAEAYKGKLIVYSMGNLIFDQQFSAEVQRSALVDMTITLEYSDELQQYLDIASDCRQTKDSCLEDIAASNVSRPDARLSYDIVATRTTDLVTSRDDAGLQAILDRLGWQEVLDQLSADQPEAVIEEE